MKNWWLRKPRYHCPMCGAGLYLYWDGNDIEGWGTDYCDGCTKKIEAFNRLLIRRIRQNYEKAVQNGETPVRLNMGRPVFAFNDYLFRRVIEDNGFLLPEPEASGLANKDASTTSTKERKHE